MNSVPHWRTTGARAKESEGGSRVRCREPLPVDEGQAAAGDPRTQATGLPRGTPVRLASPHGVAGLPPLTFAFHDKATIPAGLVRKILVRDLGLAEDEARKLL